MNTARGGVAAGLALVATLLLARAVAAHALPQSSDPSAGANLATPPTAVTITFGERPDPKLSSIKVLTTSGTLVSSDPTTVVSSDPLGLTVGLSPLAPGVYTVAWRTVSAVDGHLATGSFAFGVGVARSPAAAGTTGAQTGAGGGSVPSSGAIVGRWLLFVGLLSLLGAASFGLIVAEPVCSSVPVVVAVAWILAAAGAGIVIAVEILESGASADEILSSSLGGGIGLRGVPILIAGGGVITARHRPGRAGAGGRGARGR